MRKEISMLNCRGRVSFNMLWLVSVEKRSRKLYIKVRVSCGMSGMK